MDWNDLRHFLAVARSGTLAGAARELKVEHTTVGRRIAALETALGAKLFTRGPDGFTLTDAGKQILAHAELVAKSVDAIERRASDDARIEGTVRLTTSEALSGYFVKQMAELRAVHPALTVEILSGNRAYDLARGEADVAIRVFPSVDDAELLVRKVTVAAWALYAAPAYIERKGALASAEDLAGHDLVDYDASMAMVPGALWLKEHGKGGNVVMRANSIVAALNAAIFGMGIASVPCWMGDKEAALRRASPTIVGARDVFLLVHPDLAKIARVRAVIDFIVAAFKRDRAAWTGEASGPA